MLGGSFSLTACTSSTNTNSTPNKTVVSPTKPDVHDEPQQPAPAPAPNPDPQPAPAPTPAPAPAPSPQPTQNCSGETFTSDTFKTATSIREQNGWKVDANLNESIVDLGEKSCRGRGVWKLANTQSTPSYSSQPLSPTLQHGAGESSTREGTNKADSFGVSFALSSVSTTGDNSTLIVSIADIDGYHDTILKFENLAGNSGLKLTAIDGERLQSLHVLTPNLSLASWHIIKILVAHIDGPKNDQVQIYVDGSLKLTHGTTESWLRANTLPPLLAQRVLFRLERPTPSSTPEGFYIDDFREWTYENLHPETALDEYHTGFEVTP